MKKIFDFIVGLGFWVALSYGGYYLFFKGEDSAREVTETDFRITLKEFKSQDIKMRHAIVAALVNKQGHLAEDLSQFTNCMGDFAANKSEDLAFIDVFSWCETEKSNNRTRFVSHFNQLDAKDLSSAAAIICQNHVDDKLISPSTADHPWLDREVWDKGKWAYTIRSYVDSENTFGATVRANYECSLYYKGVGEELNPNNWKLDKLEFN